MNSKESTQDQTVTGWRLQDGVKVFTVKASTPGDDEQQFVQLADFLAAKQGRRIDVDWLSNVIRAVDGRHDLGAGALAERIVEAIDERFGPP